MTKTLFYKLLNVRLILLNKNKRTVHRLKQTLGRKPLFTINYWCRFTLEYKTKIVMKRVLFIVIGLFWGVNILAQEKNSIKNAGTAYISGNDFTNVLLEKRYNTISDITIKNDGVLNNWRLKSNRQECELCENIYADLTPVWNDAHFEPNTVIMRYIIRPSSSIIDMNYTYNIIDAHTGNMLITKLTEVNSGKEKIINIHDNNENKNVKSKINVIPGRAYYVDIIANYATNIVKTIFQFDNLNITEQISSGSIVFNNLNYK